MQYAIICQDKENHEDLRKATRDAHLAYISDFSVSLAGPMLSDDGQQMIGSIIIIEADSIEAAHEFAASDPYKLAGLFETVTIRAFRQVIPAK